MDIRQSPNYAKYLESLGWIVEKAPGGNIFVRKLPILSFLSVIKVQRTKELALSVVEKIAKKYHAFLVKIEPDYDARYEILNSEYKKDGWPLLPSKTLVLDLKNISLPKGTRYEIRKAQSHGLFIRPPLASQGEALISDFYRMLQETMKLGHWSVPIRKEVTNLFRAFQSNKATILLTYCPTNPLPIAGCLLVWDGNTAHYMYAANTARGRELSAAYFTLWEAIKFCQRKKLKFLDLEGIYDERYAKHTKNWIGFTKFKMGWGGKIIQYPGSWTKYQLPSAQHFELAVLTQKAAGTGKI